MAKILTRVGNKKGNALQDFNDTVDDAYRNQLESKYSIFIEGRPTFVTLYTQNKATSTADLNLDGTVELLGTDSSIRYNRVLNFPIYGLDEVDFNSELTQYGNDVSQIEGDLITLPNTIKLVPNDLIVLDKYKDYFFIRITNVAASHVDGRSFYKCNYQLVTPREEVDKQVEDDYVTDFSEIGMPDGNPIIRKSIVEYTNFLEDVSSSLLDMYREKFDWGSVLLNPQDGVYYLDIYLFNFIKETKLFESYKYRNSNILTDPNEFRYIDKFEVIKNYNRSIYELLDDKYDIEQLKGNLHPTHIYIKHLTKFGDILYYKHHDKEILLSNITTNSTNDIDNDLIFTKTLLSNDFLLKLEDEQSDIELRYIEEVLFKLHTYKYMPKENIIDGLDELIADLNNIDLIEDEYSYWLIPIILYKVKQHIEIYHSGV